MTAAPAADPIRDAAAHLIELDGGEVRLPAPRPITDAYLEQLGHRYELLRFEASRGGDLIITNASKGLARTANGILRGQTSLWSHAAGGGVYGFDAGYHPPGWDWRIPAISWVSHESEERVPLVNGQLPAYWPVSPDFVIETRSPNDSLRVQREKAQAWADHGTPLALLVDPRNRAVYRCRPHREAEMLRRPATVSCEPEMPGLLLDFEPLWELADRSG